MATKIEPVRRVDLPTVRLRRWRRGDPLTAAHLDEVVGAVSGLRGGVPKPRQVFGDERDSETGAAVAVQVQEFVVASVHGDFITCRQNSSAPADSGASTTTYTMLAKPYLLRRSPFDGLSRDAISYAYDSDIARTATNADDDTESQVVVPSYVVGDVVYGISLPSSVTVVQTDGSETDVEWQDINADGRAWAEV